MWELLQIKVLQPNSKNVGTNTQSRFYSLTPKMWELTQIEVLQPNSKNVGTITNRGFTA